eukprot:COSAG05_NODE_20874_length_276_cov_0.587571_1_plen_40_part_01
MMNATHTSLGSTRSHVKYDRRSTGMRSGAQGEDMALTKVR